MKKVIGVIVFIILFISSQNVVAQTFKFGHINSQELLQSMPEYKTMSAEMDSLKVALENDLELQQVELNNKYEKYLKEEKTLVELVRQTRYQELTDMQTKIANFQTQASTTLNDKYTALFTPISAKADKAIKDVSKENGFTYVFDLSIAALVYYDETKSVNILPLVKVKLGIK
jgi:outer membrane protein